MIERLPSGRHGIPRERVHEHQRARLVQAIERAMFHGRPPLRTHPIARAAGVSPKTFYVFWPNIDAAVAEVSALVADRLRTFEGRAPREHLMCAALAAGEIYAERNGGQATPLLRGKITEAAACLSIALQREGWELRPVASARRHAA